MRAITDRLDAVGNVTKANTKGYSVGSAALACFLLFAAFLDEVTLYSGVKFERVDLAVPEVFVGGLIGSMTVFLFASYAMTAVGKTAQMVVQEVGTTVQETLLIGDSTHRRWSSSSLYVYSRPVGIVVWARGYFVGGKTSS